MHCVYGCTGGEVGGVGVVCTCETPSSPRACLTDGPGDASRQQHQEAHKPGQVGADLGGVREREPTNGGCFNT